jgi:hypothetical protein
MRERLQLAREKGIPSDRREPTSKRETSPVRQWKPMVLSVRPEIRVITHRHRFYITAGKGERYRLSANLFLGKLPGFALVNGQTGLIRIQVRDQLNGSFKRVPCDNRSAMLGPRVPSSAAVICASDHSKTQTVIAAALLGFALSVFAVELHGGNGVFAHYAFELSKAIHLFDSIMYSQPNCRRSSSE